MKRKELTKIFEIEKTLWSPWFIQKYFSVAKVKQTTETTAQQEWCDSQLKSNHVCSDYLLAWGSILVQVTINRRLRIGRDGHLDQTEAHAISYLVQEYRPEDISLKKMARLTLI